METQSDLEVILEFLEDYYRHTGGHGDDVYCTAVEPEDERSAPADEGSCEAHWTCSEPTSVKPALQPFLAHDAPPGLSQNTTTALCERGSHLNCASARQPSKHTAGRVPVCTAVAGRKVRLYHFLFEMLEDPNMAHCVSWVPAAAGVFRFSSTNKHQVAALWGQRKGNKRPMTYQKMSRALRNYSRSGEIFKVKKKLTYEFSRETLTLLRKCQQGDL
ncbi:ETS domain-containing transcription factor ets-5 isoform X2 [Gasterosteus aculeatus]|uniref:ETS domain-containing transcription factor ets-5 isoform X2 n=1 Tax=Gasterosteus aculeatus aculeatus TaxID=481459 RepID=UPI001A97FCC0|nr:ETS domain-containing transcription factor ets-5 isoform X2 [Gasterosteus aculeatus aculeatus]